jgi:hypothetical protein
MAFELTAAALEALDLLPTEKLVLALLAHHANSASFFCVPSKARISSMSGLSERQIQRIISALKKRGMIQQLPRRRKTTPKYKFPGLMKPVNGGDAGVSHNKGETAPLREEGRLTAKKTIHTREDDSF